MGSRRQFGSVEGEHCKEERGNFPFTYGVPFSKILIKVGYANEPLPFSLCLLHQGRWYKCTVLRNKESVFVRILVRSKALASLSEMPHPESVFSVSDFGETGPPNESSINSNTGVHSIEK